MSDKDSDMRDEIKRFKVDWPDYDEDVLNKFRGEKNERTLDEVQLLMPEGYRSIGANYASAYQVVEQRAESAVPFDAPPISMLDEQDEVSTQGDKSG